MVRNSVPTQLEEGTKEIRDYPFNTGENLTPQ
jgi:hypothetical protein